MKAPNGFGSVSKLSGNRRRPFQVRVTIGWELNEKGKQVQKYKTIGYFEKRKDALLALAEYNTHPHNLTSEDLTFSEIYKIWSTKHFEQYPSSEGGLKSAYKRCEPLYRMKIKDIRTVHLREVMDTVSHMSEQTQIKVKTVIKNTYKYALENDIILKDYSEFIQVTYNKPQKKRKFFTKDEVKIIFENSDFTVDFPISRKDKSKLNLMDSVYTMLYTGVRVSELLEIQLDDINFEEKTIHVRGTKTENADRIVPIHEELLPILEKYKDNKYLVENGNGKPISYAYYKMYYFDEFMKFLGLPHTPHACRHTFISLMDSSGVSASSVALKRIVGHCNDSVTEDYTHKTLEELREKINMLKLT